MSRRSVFFSVTFFSDLIRYCELKQTVSHFSLIIYYYFDISTNSDLHVTLMIIFWKKDHNFLSLTQFACLFLDRFFVIFSGLLIKTIYICDCTMFFCEILFTYITTIVDTSFFKKLCVPCPRMNVSMLERFLPGILFCQKTLLFYKNNIL